jgi:threonine/homoserine/homoserine lactone efflux protein
VLDSTTLISFGLAATALIVMPEPATLYIVTRSLDQGRQAGIACALIAGKMRQWLAQHASFLRRQKYVVGGTYIALGMAAATVSPARK